MSLIHVLTPEISNKIAAGEVVERPASVVKELVENSIDAGATRITVEINNGGISLISVTDNGSGMSPEDAQIAFLRHATSKIQTEDDLDAIYTLGFRGEALSSIGAVSQAAIYTKRKEDEFGTVVTCEGGEIIASDEGGMSDGTKITVRNLFYNTPARMKFLKKDSTEAGYITDVMTRFVLSHPEIVFRFVKNGKDVINSSGDGILQNAVYAVYGRDYATNLIDVDYEIDGVKVSGVIGNTKLARPNRSFQSFYVNKRNIKSPLIIRALEEAFKNQIMIGKFPVAVLNVEVNPLFIDINVHPTKLEVKFSDEKKIYDAVYYGTKSALYAIPGKAETPEIKHNPRENPFLLKKEPEVSVGNVIEPQKTKQEEIVPVVENKVKTETPKIAEQKPAPKVDSVIKVEIKEDPIAAFRKKPETEPVKMVFETPKVEYSVAEPVEIPKVEPVVNEPVEPVLTEQITIEEKSPVSEKETDIQQVIAGTDIDIKIAGQIFNTYIIAQSGDEMLLIDQHAAHERIKYEQLLDSMKNKQCYQQILLEPVIVKLGGAEMSAFDHNSESFAELGFDAEVFGENEIIVRAAPQDVEWGDVEDLFVELLSELGDSKKDVISSKLERMTYTIACKSAVKANYTLSESEMEGLVKSVMALENINTCPHGRPITVTITKKELEKMFKRIV